MISNDSNHTMEKVLLWSYKSLYRFLQSESIMRKVKLCDSLAPAKQILFVI